VEAWVSPLILREERLVDDEPRDLDLAQSAPLVDLAAVDAHGEHLKNKYLWESSLGLERVCGPQVVGRPL